MKRLRLIQILASAFFISINAFAADRVTLSGNMPSWQMLVLNKSGSDTSSQIAKALNKEEEFKKNRTALSVKMAESNLVTSSYLGLSYFNQPGQVLLGTWFIVGSSCANGGDTCDKNATQLSDFLNSFNYPWGESTLQKDLSLIELSMLNSLNEELKAHEDFVNTVGTINEIILDRNTGVLKSFSTSKAYYFERREKNNTYWYVGHDQISRDENEMILFFNFELNK